MHVFVFFWAYVLNNLRFLVASKNSWFCDLFVRVSNKVAFEMYTKSDYIVYRKIIDYYTGVDKDEDAYGEPLFWQVQQTSQHKVNVFVIVQTRYAQGHATWQRKEINRTLAASRTRRWTWLMNVVASDCWHWFWFLFSCFDNKLLNIWLWAPPG